MIAREALNWDKPDPHDAGYWVALRDALVLRRIPIDVEVVEHVPHKSWNNLVASFIVALRTAVRSGIWASNPSGDVLTWHNMHDIIGVVFGDTLAAVQPTLINGMPWYKQGDAILYNVDGEWIYTTTLEPGATPVETYDPVTGTYDGDAYWSAGVLGISMRPRGSQRDDGTTPRLPNEQESLTLGQTPIAGYPMDHIYISRMMIMLFNATKKLRYRRVQVELDLSYIEMPPPPYPATIEGELPNTLIQRLSGPDGWGIISSDAPRDRGWAVVPVGTGLRADLEILGGGTAIEYFSCCRSAFVINPLAAIGTLVIAAVKPEARELDHPVQFDAIGTGLTEGLNEFRCEVGITTFVPTELIVGDMMPRVLDNNSLPPELLFTRRGMDITGLIDYGYGLFFTPPED